MLYVVWIILKILLIILAVLLGLILLAVLLVLFVPVRYRGQVKAGEKKDALSNIYVQGKVTWLLHFISFRMEYLDKQINLQLRICGISVLEGNDKQKNKTKKIKQTTKAPQQSMMGKGDFAPEMSKGNQSSELSAKNTCENYDRGMSSKDIREEYASVPLQENVRNIQKNIASFKSKLEYYRRLWYDGDTRASVSHVKKELFYILRHVGPRKVDGWLYFGFDDPATTGEVLGILYVLQSFSGNHLCVEADFERKLFEGEFSLTGHLRMVHFLKVFLALLLDKHCRITFQRLKNR